VRSPEIRCLKCVDALRAALHLTKAMNSSKFRVVALPTDTADEARQRAAEGRPAYRISVVDSPKSAPCRHCLQWAKPGERVILFPYGAIPSGRPYSETGPIFVHAESCQRYDEQSFPSQFREGRVFRAYNAADDLIDARLPNGDEPEAVIEKLFENPEITFVHARSVTHGCYTFRVERI
jgi:hypothetical protein